ASAIAVALVRLAVCDCTLAGGITTPWASSLHARSQVRSTATGSLMLKSKLQGTCARAVQANMIWSLFAAIFSLLGFVASLALLVHLRRGMNVRVSGVRYSLFSFFVYVCMWSLLRAFYFGWLALLPRHLLVDRHGVLNPRQLDRIGVHTAFLLKAAHNGWITVVSCGGDTALFGVALWTFPLTHEIVLVTKESMDRGAVREKHQIRIYQWPIRILIVTFIAVEISFAVHEGGYARGNHLCLLLVYFFQFGGLAYTVPALVYMKCRGYDQASIHGRFVSAPLYSRLKRMMIVYVVCAFQYQIMSVIVAIRGFTNGPMLEFIGFSMVLFNTTGFALVVISGCSFDCIVHLCRCCWPHEFRQQVEAELQSTVIAQAPVSPPLVNPVFVSTDIESSSALWAIGGGEMMQKATEIHDDTLRSLLAVYRGYEIATCGDAFQLAFHSIDDAVEYCIAVQMKLLAAPWPRALHGAVPATRRRVVCFRTIFRGLRVRMAVHAASDADGAFVSDRHPITGKTVYTGAAVLIANELAELGGGGQILVTRIVAEALQNQGGDYLLDFADEYVMPQLHHGLDVFQLTPWALRGRRTAFKCALRHHAVTISAVTETPRVNYISWP
ncbi:TPA: hypothetical protein N0F65_009508, partial [Lagenidium giganteum]